MTTETTLLAKFKEVEMFRTCEQCGLCSSACPITGKEGFNVRRILRHIEMELADEVANTSLPWICTTCGRCETVCPNGIAILGLLRNLRTLSPAEFTPDGSPPCAKACPGGIDIPGYLRLIAQGKPQEAYELILERVPFPGVLGRVCTHPCENQCRRREVNQPVSICALKRFAADKAGPPSQALLNVAPDTGRKVAVVGSGPAGLTTAFFLRKKGHQVTVFEARPLAGGMMRYGIPAYRLPEKVLEREIELVFGLGIELKTNQKLGVDFDLPRLQQEGYEAIFLSLGLPESRKISLEGAELQGVLWGMDFLSAVRDGREMVIQERVLVIGGGNVAVDVALTARRIGAKEVTMACLESRPEMPANPWEVEMALEEGVRIMTSWGPRRILGENGHVTGIELVCCTEVFDVQGCFSPQFDAQITHTEQVDQVIFAVGQSADLSCLEGDCCCDTARGIIEVDYDTQATSVPGVFAGGDMAVGPGTIIQAIASGKRASSYIDKYLGGDGIIEPASDSIENGQPYDGTRARGFADLPRMTTPTLPLAERLEGFKEVDLCPSDDEAIAEAARCLQCDLEHRLALIGRSCTEQHST
jgi:NADPH-dependent glutamate synthase beta subunit-like oxidoreductase/NAD-dependent dihydropyrimidine dehydrogenase PreA subunit